MSFIRKVLIFSLVFLIGIFILKNYLPETNLLEKIKEITGMFYFIIEKEKKEKTFNFLIDGNFSFITIKNGDLNGSIVAKKIYLGDEEIEIKSERLNIICKSFEGKIGKNFLSGNCEEIVLNELSFKNKNLKIEGALKLNAYIKESVKINNFSGKLNITNKKKYLSYILNENLEIDLKECQLKIDNNLQLTGTGYRIKGKNFRFGD